ncbi:MAG: hypothetical protein CVT92_08620 [Bacteroidetes bacterium HGW-Bacteroidetes-1]|jgi:putative ABC transport system permease protein|nr:MAG: hypothetical protein CVT92_08620 [Bacteroidetes bacterium HGW-Bacteroidetes-1]
MLKNFFLTSYRRLLRQPGFSLINIFGLAIGLAACLLILLYITDELSYDRFHEKADRIYRVTTYGKFGNNEFHSTYTPAPFAEAIIREFPEVESVTRLMVLSQHSVRVGEKTFIEDRFAYADSVFFDVFSFELIEGDPKRALTEPRTIILTESTARRYFGKEDPMGKMIIENDMHHYRVTGIAKDIPYNSHFRFNALASFTSLAWHSNKSWFNQSAQTYLVFAKGTDVTLTEEKLNPFIYRNIKDQLFQFIGISFEEFAKSGQTYGYNFQKLTDIHLLSNLDGELEANGNITYVYLFSLIALFILLIACINFMNLSTARSVSRAKEVGIRKVLGSQRADIIFQFLAESFVYVFIAMILAVLLIEISMPFFNHISNKHLSFSFNTPSYFLLSIPVFIVITGLIAGSYPAFFMSAFQPLQVIKGQFFQGMTKNRPRSLLVLFQYSISIVLLISTFVIFSQLKFIQKKNMGYEKENMLIIKRVHGLNTGLQVFKQKLLQHPEILNASYTLDLPGDDFGSNSMGVAGRPLEEVNLLMVMFADYDLLETLGIKLSEGRWFSKDFGTDSSAVILNEAAMRALGITDLNREKVIRHATPPYEHLVSPIIGVVEDFHFESLHKGIRPMAIYLRNDGWLNRMVVKVKGEKLQELIQVMEKEWNNMETGQPFTYTTLDQNMASFYQNDHRTRIIYTIFSLLALFVASLGLFGLAAYTTESRTKEIGIRKVLGANISKIIFMLTKEFTKYVLLANLIAWPFAFWLADNWLNNFAYRIAMPWSAFVGAAVLSFAIALLTVFFLAFKAARSNPVNALKYE